MIACVYKANMAQLSEICARKTPSLLIHLRIVSVWVVYCTTQLHEENLVVLGISIPGFLELGGDDDMGPQGVQGCDFRFKMITLNVRNSKTRKSAPAPRPCP